MEVHVGMMWVWALQMSDGKVNEWCEEYMMWVMGGASWWSDMSGNARPVKGVSSSHSSEISSATFELDCQTDTHTHSSYIPSPNQQQKKNSARQWCDYEVIDDETHDEIAVKTVSKFLAHMTWQGVGIQNSNLA